ncbi:EF-hand calcium-binding domain-containing protein 3-like isoform X2 [Sus scrofa]|uniref:EF-hand calcium-binding domain-containing protein 3-like isoform X2 n=1 Tax=Sus scrofa TaxID=9823 RepID=UPI000A2B52B7|nr:EF-hand calcium-binding domain-containing protein 3-like isoform X2 [Sus scrofa]
MEPAAAAAPGAEQASQRAREFKGLGAHTVQSGPRALSQSFADKNLLPLTPRQLAGDGSVSFEDFLGVLTDSHRLAQCLGKVRNSRVCDPHGLQTLFLETLFKLMSLGFVPYKSAQEVMSYYSRKQRSLRLNCSWKGGPRCHGSTGRSHAGLAFFCQATRLSGLSNAELARTLQGLHKEGARSPYSQVPTLNGRMQPECYTQNRTSRPEVRLPKSYWRSPPKRQVDREGSWASHWGICAPRSWLPPPQL